MAEVNVLEDSQSEISALDTAQKEAVEDALDEDSINKNQPPEVDLSPDELNASNGSSTDSCSPGKFFRRFPELECCYERGPWGKNRRAVYTCLGCGFKVNSSDTKRLAKHAINCKEISLEVRELIKIKMANIPFQNTSEESKKFDRQNLQFLRILVRKNVPFTLLDDRLFKNFLTEHCQGVSLVSRQVMAERYLSYEANNASNRMAELVNSAEDYHLSIEFDHLSDFSHRSVLAIIATTANGARILIALEDVSLFGKSAEAIIEPLKRAFKEFPKTKINSIISDSASSCKLAREKLAEHQDFQHIIQHRCLAHLLNSVGENFSEQTVIKEMIGVATKLSTFINNRPKIAAELKKAGHNRVQKATKTRWYSLVNMLESLFSVKDDLVTLIEHSNEQEARELLNEIVFLHEMSSAIRVLRPLANCIAIAEKVDGSVSETFSSVLEFAKSLTSLNWDHQIVAAGINSFLTYFSYRKLQDEFSLIIAAYCLDRRFKMDYLTEVAIERAFLQIRIIARRSGYSSSALKLLSRNFVSFCRQEGEYSKIPNEGQSSLDWWQSIPRRGVLKDIGIRLANLKSSSANCERTFSEIKQMQCPNRANYSMETLERMMTVKLSINQELEEMEDDQPSNLPSSQPATIIPTRSRRRQPTMLPTQIATLPEDCDRIENCSQASSCSTLLTFSQGDRDYCPPLNVLQRDNLAAYKEFKELFDFRVINEYISQSIEVRNEIDHNDNEALEDFRRQLNQ